MQGWRPVAEKGDNLRARRRADGAIVYPPLWSSGIRMSPQVVDDALRLINN